MNYSTLSIREKAVSAYLNSEPVDSISEMFNVHRATIYRWISKYHEKRSLERSGSPGSGRPSILSDKQRNELTKLILKPATEYGYETDFWTINRIVEIGKTYLNVNISKTTMYEILHNENFSYKKPEKRYYETNEKEQKDWIKNTIPEIKECVKKHKGILYFEDESTIALTAVLGKTWGPVGQKIIHKSTAERGSVAAMSAISQDGRLLFTLHEKKITSIEVIRFLDQMLKHHPTRHIIVVMDKAPPHTSGITNNYIKSQKRLHVFHLPARSPEWNPDEKVWNYLKNEELKSHQAKNKKELKFITNRKLKKMSKKPRLLHALFKRCEVSEFFRS